MAAVAERAGVSRRAVYLHFSSRTELLTELFGYVSEQEGLAASLQPVWQAPDAAAALQEWARHLARFHPRILAVARAIQRVRRVDPDAAAHWGLVMADQQACCHRLAVWLAREQRLAPPWTVQTAADMLWALMSFELLEELLVDRGWTLRRYRTYLAALFKSTFLCNPHQAQAAPTDGARGPTFRDAPGHEVLASPRTAHSRPSCRPSPPPSG
jgi:AcrR family transcriptional regulator